ncbi:unnamed protein product [Rotaria sp. Silwood1]|nr:unnamed protein product [Rotaria sp. Silwood1]CAF1439287.1 unnamed protein product [Rotaria sp. Silwood1]CAF3584698.1 unnamed protein product [Rotaria sp. Silwood1]CAF3616194.1 unnamed protein product [Rotaria sp. Silwood1]CAF3678557.1 unnamed protein product [Rotaria sp. Silwood1]
MHRDIDHRFTIRQLNTPFHAVTLSISSITNKTSSYISIRNSSQLPVYNHRTRYLFDIPYYTELTNVERRSNKTRYR